MGQPPVCRLGAGALQGGEPGLSVRPVETSGSGEENFHQVVRHVNEQPTTQPPGAFGHQSRHKGQREPNRGHAKC